MPRPRREEETSRDRIIVRVTPDEHEQLRRAARESRATVADVVRSAVADYVEELCTYETPGRR